MDFEESDSQSSLVIIASKKYASFNSEKEFFAGESIFLSTLSTVAIYVKSKCQAYFPQWQFMSK